MKEILSKFVLIVVVTLNDKEKVVRRLEGTSIKIVQKKLGKNITDSFFYDGIIAEARSRNGTELQLIATGEVKIRNKNGVVYRDGWEYNDNFGFKVDTDKDLKKINSDNGFEWEMNNWFEVLFTKPGTDYADSDVGEIVHDYDSAIQLLESYLEDERFSK